MGSIGDPHSLNTPLAGSGSDCSSRLTQELRASLSPHTCVYSRGDDLFSELTLRWQKYKSPSFQTSVAVASEQDVVNTVRFANNNDIPFLACASSHGAIDMSSLRNGIQIWMRKLNAITVDSERNVATIGGGCLTYEAIAELWKHGKQTTTGMGEAVGMSGLVLGGGHGLLQGVYGLAADQLISARLVLWDGTVILASETSNPGLFWAIRGAGHNFGIVTEMQYRIYDVLKEKRKWISETLIFKADCLEDVVNAANDILDTQPPDLLHFLYIKIQPEMDPINPILKFIIMYNNDEVHSKYFSDQIRKFGPIFEKCVEIEYPEHPREFESGKDDFVSYKVGATTAVMRFPTGAYRYNASATRSVYDKYSTFTAQNPQFGLSFIMLEGYSTHAVRKVPEESTAVGFRNERLFFSPCVIFEDNDDIELQRKALAFGHDLRDSFGRDSELSAYVNYAMGDEGAEAWYGYEPWRMEKLKSLKRKWDPHQKFSFYAPIPLD